LYAGGVLRDMQIDLSTIYQSAALIMGICLVLLMIIKSKTKPDNGLN